MGCNIQGCQKKKNVTHCEFVAPDEAWRSGGGVLPQKILKLGFSWIRGKIWKAGGGYFCQHFMNLYLTYFYVMLSRLDVQPGFCSVLAFIWFSCHSKLTTCSNMQPRKYFNPYTPNAVVELLPHRWDNIFVETTACAVYSIQSAVTFSSISQMGTCAFISCRATATPALRWSWVIVVLYLFSR